MDKFKVGDIVYIYSFDRFGVVSDVSKSENIQYPVRVTTKDGGPLGRFTEDGRQYSININPDLFTIEEAIKRGFITQEAYDKHQPKKKVKYRHVLYKVLYEGNSCLYVSNKKFKSLKEFKKLRPDLHFVSFLKTDAEWREE